MVADNVISPERFGWLEQVCHEHFMPLNILLQDAYEELLFRRLQYSVLVDSNHRVQGMVSFQRLANVLSLRYGKELYGHMPVDRVEIPARLAHGSDLTPKGLTCPAVIGIEDILFVNPDFDLFEAVRLFNARSHEHYYDDLVVVDRQGRYQGLLSSIRFNQIHSQFTRTQELRLADQNRRLQNTLDDLSRTQAELVAKSKMASLGELIAGIAHEMNTPLGVLLSSHEIIEMGLENLSHEQNPVKVEKLRSLVAENRQRATQASTRVCSIINSLKVFGRQTQEEMFPADMNDLVSSTLTLMGNVLKAGIEVVVESLDDPCVVECHVDQIGQVLLNVVTNAIHAMNGQGTLSITLIREDDQARITIGDTGPGIPEALLERIFDPGFTTKGVGVGTGLGLSISRKIIEENHGGKISAQNAPGGGAIFTITIPLKPKTQTYPSQKRQTHEHEIHCYR